MRTHAQLNPECTRLSQLIAPMSVAMLTTEADRDTLVSRPMAPLEMDADGALWFFLDLRSAKVEQLRAVNLTFSDPDHGTYVSVSGRGEVHADQERIDELWTESARPWFPDGPAASELALLKVVPSGAEYWDAPSSKMARLFALAASVAARKPIGMGRHKKLTRLAQAEEDAMALI